MTKGFSQNNYTIWLKPFVFVFIFYPGPKGTGQLIALHWKPGS